MKTIGVLANCHKPGAAAALKRLAGSAGKMGLKLLACDETAPMLPRCCAVAARELAGRIDALVALGGDGTLLRGARLLAGRAVPVLGVNLGRLGFMTSVAAKDLGRALKSLVTGRYSISKRAVAECRLVRGGRTLGRYRALNDIVIGWGASSRLMTLNLRIDGEQVATYHCDGLIVATPTGSTAHALSAGGPILHPDCASFVVCAICPHTLSNRPLVLSDRKRLEVEVTRTAKNLILSVDGQEEPSVEPGDRVEIRRSARDVRLVQLPDYSYFSVLRHKLNWRGSSV
ncbi:MAG TPA: NAD(+)/NADH kinase [Kiritimatiellia bacterium]|nr:NAD(+)/NADH kinase [Kiritimatiellia bacterium]HRZ11178.1 NAD(+)/NADH kinase [Kiritimatiellia bacterium]HSA19029.1 NAD(+)/NADH kinase [Kiritimatiellia bacterium]